VRRLGLEVMSEAVAVAPGARRAAGEGVGHARPRLDRADARRLTRPGSPSLLAKHALLLAVGAKYRRLRSSMLIAIERGREPAVDFLNGEVVRARQTHRRPDADQSPRAGIHRSDIARRERRPAVELLRALYDEDADRRERQPSSSTRRL
jgi:2-dehydropantoate 2-reductase